MNTDHELQFSSVQSLDQLDRRGDMRDDSAKIQFQSLLREALVSSSGMGSSHLISSHSSLNREGRWGTTDDFATSFLHFFLFSTAAGT